MTGTEQLHLNIKEQQMKHRYRNNDIDAHIGTANGTFATKMSRLKAGSTYSITVSDISNLMKLFKCTCGTLLKDVDFKKDEL